MGALYLLCLAATTGCIGWLLKEQHHSTLPASSPIRTPRVRLVEVHPYDWEEDQ